MRPIYFLQIHLFHYFLQQPMGLGQAPTAGLPGMLVGAGTPGPPPPGQGSPSHHPRHLSPNFPSAVPRHGSLPNVNAAMGTQVGKMISK